MEDAVASVFDFPRCGQVAQIASLSISPYSHFSCTNNDRNNDSLTCSLQLTVDFPTMADSHHQDKKGLVPDFIQDAVISHAQAVAFLAFQFLYSRRAWVLG